MNNRPPSFICFVSPDNLLQCNDDHSELTEPIFGNGISQTNDSGVNLDYGHGLDRKIPSNIENHQEINILKLQIAKQQEKLNNLSSKLRQCQDENEALKKEKAVLVDALVDENQPGVDGGKPMQFLVNANTKLIADNARLQVVLDVMRKSFKKHIESIRKSDEKVRPASTILQRENELLRQQLLEMSGTERDTILSKCTATTIPLDGSYCTWSNKEEVLLPLDSSQRSSPSMTGVNSLLSFTAQDIKFELSGNGWIAKASEDIEDKEEKNNNRAGSRRSDPSDSVTMVSKGYEINGIVSGGANHPDSNSNMDKEVNAKVAKGAAPPEWVLVKLEGGLETPQPVDCSTILTKALQAEN
eukprot:CAMPEP_0201886386 /NCGR_PEP_ID=MMETSP0902-20130614/21923_1 /ASSEMBLY_ACC=CAM_ASM_000551 /TAXON_ID=420261 /ORGANISM="Thalassiosira antarctica, Strain CCMP982" /LENGTH=356 /DNA_ID=CAMNT_0048415947 /DNA_START=56 /DNA_END=1127 /DNA_ORIENTATION=-